MEPLGNVLLQDDVEPFVRQRGFQLFVQAEVPFVRLQGPHRSRRRVDNQKSNQASKDEVPEVPAVQPVLGDPITRRSLLTV